MRSHPKKGQLLRLDAAPQGTPHMVSIKGNQFRWVDIIGILGAFLSGGGNNFFPQILNSVYQKKILSCTLYHILLCTMLLCHALLLLCNS